MAVLLFFDYVYNCLWQIWLSLVHPASHTLSIVKNGRLFCLFSVTGRNIILTCTSLHHAVLPFCDCLNYSLWQICLLLVHLTSHTLSILKNTGLFCPFSLTGENMILTCTSFLYFSIQHHTLKVSWNKQTFLPIFPYWQKHDCDLYAFLTWCVFYCIYYYLWQTGILLVHLASPALSAVKNTRVFCPFPLLAETWFWPARLCGIPRALFVSGTFQCTWSVWSKMY